LQYWAEALSAQGHQVIISTHTEGPDPGKARYRIMRKPAFWTLVKTMRQADIVVMINVALKQMPQWWLSGTPLLVSHHTAYRYDHRPPSWQARLKRWVANRLAAGQCACSAYIAQPYQHCSVVPNPFRWQPVEIPAEKLPYSILFAGRLVPDKGVDLLLAAMPLVLQKLPQARLAIVGDGPERKTLENTATALKVGEAVQFFGEQSTAKVQQMMRQHALLVVPSRMEPFGIVVLEGMAAGCHLLLARQGGLPEAGGPWAAYTDPENSQAFAAAMVHSLQQPPPTPAVQGARQVFLEKHHPYESAKALESCLEACLAKSKTA
jgi:glycosyltransferase involved in cell wall biosynthesis